MFSLGGCGTQVKTVPATPPPAQISPAHTAEAPSPSSGTPQERGQAALPSRKTGASSQYHPESAGLSAWVMGDDGTLLHASDGSRTPETISFPDALHGWAVVSRRSPAPVTALLATTDGGAAGRNRESVQGMAASGLRQRFHQADQSLPGQ